MDTYEKKYKEIVGKIRKAYLYAQTDSTKAVLKEIIPELAESEDEKVRKALLELVHDTTGDELWIDYNVHKEEALDWLERQGDYANFRDKAQVGDRITKNEDGVLVNLSQLRRVAKPSEKQGEQKFEMKTAEESLGISSDEYNKIVDECLFGEQKLTEFERGLFDMLTDISKPCTADCVKSHSEKLLSIARKMIALEQKPEENKGNIGGISANWSEEDEEYNGEDYGIDSLYHAQRILEKTLGKVDGYQTDDGILSHKCAITAVKKLYEQKSAWSEEDEQHIDSLLKRLDALCRNKFERTRFAISEDRDWLKSLRPQNTYNPYKAVVESIAEMCKHYDKASHSGLQDFYDNVKVKCKDAKEYDSIKKE